MKNGARQDVLTLGVPGELVEAIAERAAELLTEQMPPPSPYLDVDGAAEYLACSSSRIYALTSTRRIPHHRDGSRLLFRREELDAWIERGGGKRP
jgi:excisionase family DNA binding protein